MQSGLIILVDYNNLLSESYLRAIKDIKIRPWMPILRALETLRDCAKACRQRNSTAPIEFIFFGDESFSKNKLLVNLRFYLFRGLMTFIIGHIGCGNVLMKDGVSSKDILCSLVNKFCKKCDCVTPCKECKCSKDAPEVVVLCWDEWCKELVWWNKVSLWKPNIFFVRGTEPMVKLSPMNLKVAGMPNHGYGIDLGPDEPIGLKIRKEYGGIAAASDDIFFAEKRLEEACRTV